MKKSVPLHSLVFCFLISILNTQCKTIPRDKFQIVLSVSQNATYNKYGFEDLKKHCELLKTRLEMFDANDISINISPDHKTIDINLKLELKDTSRLKRVIEAQGKLEFFETYRLMEIVQYMSMADKKLLEFNKKLLIDSAKHPFFESLAPMSDSMSARRPVIGFVRLGDTAKINALLRLPEVKSEFPEQIKFVWAYQPQEKTDVLELYALRGADLPPYRAALYGDVITDARYDIDSRTGSYVVDMQMNAFGASEWAQITKRNVGRPLAIVLDDKVMSAPNILNEITGGNSQISGNFKSEDAKDLANILKSGYQPFFCKIIKFERLH